jgi:hypothetical protein
MSPEIIEIYRRGLVLEAFNATRNILIWQYIANEVTFLETQSKFTKSLYSFTQQSALTNFVLSLGKLYDRADKYSTLCITYFLNQLKTETFNASEIIETDQLKRLLREFNSPEYLIEAITANDKSEFPKLLSEHYLKRYNETTLQSDIDSLKTMRDKAIAHNEAIESLSLEFTTAERLLKFVTEIIAIFGLAYQSTIWGNNSFSFLRMNAEREAYFIIENINKLKHP